MYFSYVTRIDFEPEELGIPLDRDLQAVRAEIKAKLDNIADGTQQDDEADDEERLSPKLEKMILNTPTTSPKRKKEIV